MYRLQPEIHQISFNTRGKQLSFGRPLLLQFKTEFLNKN